MRREKSEPRANWRQRCEDAGFSFHSMGGTYWDESVCYRFSSSQIDQLESATAELHQLCLRAAEEAVRSRRFAEFAIPEPFHELVAQSWKTREPTLYGRFDFSWDGEGEPKLLEYNADTPTALLEASVVQWHWLEDVQADADQFNSLHERLIEAFRRFGIAPNVLHLAAITSSPEDRGTVEYLADCAMQAGLKTVLIDMAAIGADGEGRFTDLDDAVITHLFKLYPWEFMVTEPFGRHLLADRATVIEPAWKMVLSNKGLLPLLWEMFPGHPNLLPSWFADQPGEPWAELEAVVRKPIFSREGANVEIRKGGAIVAASEGEYGAEGFIVQAHTPLPKEGDDYAVIGSWVVAGQPAGIGIREDASPITKDLSRFVPHFIAP